MASPEDSTSVLFMSSGWSRRIVPAALGTAMLAILIAAALSPNTGAIPAQSNCQYNCTASTPAFPWWIVAVVVAVVVVALVALLFVMRGRRPPTSGSSLQPWAGGPQPPAGASPPTPPAAAPAYLETAADIGHAPPAVSVGAGAAAGGAAGAAAGAATEGEPDIDSLMAELDKISGEILKRAPKKGSGGSSTPPPEDEE
jgi:hypothetical protein